MQDVFQTIAENGEDVYVAWTANNLGALLSALGERGEARRLYQQAYDIRRRLAEAEPLAYEPDLAMTANNLAIFYLDQKDWLAAAPLAAEAVLLHAALIPSAPPIFQERLGLSLQQARRLCQAIGFRSERESWLHTLKGELTKRTTPDFADQIEAFISMTDEELEQAVKAGAEEGD